MIIYFKCVLLLFVLLFFRIDVTDNIKPKIELISPLNRTDIVRGHPLRVCAVLSDNMMLNDFQIRISKGGSEDLSFVTGFSCNHLTNACVDAMGNPLPMIKDKKKVRLDFCIGIEKYTVVGDYYFMLLVKDKAGNKQIIKSSFNVVRD